VSSLKKETKVCAPIKIFEFFKRRKFEEHGQLMDLIDFHSMGGEILYGSPLGPMNRLVTNILQNIFFCDQKKKKLIQVCNILMTELSFSIIPLTV